VSASFSLGIREPASRVFESSESHGPTVGRRRPSEGAPQDVTVVWGSPAKGHHECN